MFNWLYFQLDNYAKIDKANEQFKLKESGVELLNATERYSAVAELQNTNLI